MIESKALPRLFQFAIRGFFCSASLISIAWSQSPQEPHIVAGQVKIPTVTEPLKLAEPNPISLQSNGQKVTSVTARWAYYDRGTLIHPLNEDDDILPVHYDSTGAASVYVAPRRLGKVQLMLFISFEDGGFERKKIDLQVGQSAGPPEELVVRSRSDYRGTPVLYMDLSEAYRKMNIFPAAIYKDVKSPIPLSAPDVIFKWINPTGAAEIDPATGIITAQYVGQALLETSFGGVSVLTCIDVMENVGGGRRSRCEELLPPGRTLPPSAWELNKTPPPVVRAHRP
jgi:hypothetical protein